MLIDLGLFSFYLGVLVLLTLGIAGGAFLNWERPGARTFGFLMLSMMIWAAFYLCEIIAPSLPLKILCRKIMYLGMGISPPLWLGFALRYTGLAPWWSKRGRVFLMTLPGLASFFLGLTNENHGLIWKSLEMPPGHEIGPLHVIFGTGFWFFTVIAYFFIGMGFLVYIYAFIRSPKTFRIQTGIMLLGALITLIVNLTFVAEPSNNHIDPTPLSFALSAPLLAFGFFRFGLYNLFPIAAPVIMENLHDAIIVTDSQNRITNLNPAAKEWMNAKGQIVGMNIFEAIPNAEMFMEKWDITNEPIKFRLNRSDGVRTWYEASVIPLHKNNAELLGRVLVVHDITQEQELLESEFRRSAHLGLLEEVGRQIASSSDEMEILQHSIHAVVDRFGYGEAAISVLTPDNMMEIRVISGTHDFGYDPGFRQEFGKGIIGHTAKTRKTYVAKNVAEDPYYFSNDEHHGSAICVPILIENKLYGALYVETIESDAVTSEDITTLETLVNQISASLQRVALYSKAQEHLRVMSAVQAVSRVVISSLDLETIFETVVRELKNSFGYSHVSIYLLKDEYLYLGAQVGYPLEMIIHKIHISQGVSGRTIKTKAVQFIPDTSREPDFLRADQTVRSEICVPLLKENVVLGTLNVEGDANDILTREDVELLTTLSSPIALAVDNARLHAQVKSMAMTDAVSGLSNRHALEEYLTAEVERSTRLGHPLSLIIFDIDSFKEYNDKWGHPAGDTRLRAIADLIRGILRKYDVAARYGGDEFAIILPNTDEHGALEFARRLQNTARAKAAEIHEERKVIPGYTLSIGVATFPKDGNSLAGILLAADHAELTAKRLGKNQIFVASNLYKNDE